MLHQFQPLTEAVFLRVKGIQVIIVGPPCSHGPRPRPENFDGCNFVGHHIGVVGMSLSSEHTPGRL